jgi:hypothetical protein
MTPREGFRFGFYYRCAEEGLSAEEARARAALGLEKAATAAPWWLGPVGSAVGTGWGGAKLLGGLALAGAAGTAALGGGAVGLGLARAQEGDVDPDEIRKHELISTYRFHADQARRRALMKAYAAGGPPR